MRKSVFEFTNEEMAIIDSIMHRKKENLTPEEVELFSEWETAKALESEENERATNEMLELGRLKVEQSKALFDIAMENLQEQQRLAIERLERTFE